MLSKIVIVFLLLFRSTLSVGRYNYPHRPNVLLLLFRSQLILLTIYPTRKIIENVENVILATKIGEIQVIVMESVWILQRTCIVNQVDLVKIFTEK